VNAIGGCHFFDIFFGGDYNPEMSKTCSIDGCDQPVAARGMCSKHYQRWRRDENTKVGSIGRPKKYPDGLGDKHKGAPRITVRLDPHILEWVKEQGGAGFLRHVAGELYELRDEERFQEWWDRLKPQEER